MTSHEPQAAPGMASRRRRLGALTVGAIGVVFGDIGTSPLYALDQLFFRHRDALPPQADVLGGISLVVWTLTLIVAVKYAIFILRADNDGEGGVFALYGLLHERRFTGMRPILFGLLVGAGLLFGDGMITPAISVLSAVEGITVMAPSLEGVVLPVTIVLLTALFLLQAKGTTGIGRIFGPVLAAWFLAIATLGIRQILQHPEILAALNPAHGLAYLGRLPTLEALLALGALMLVVTGGEAMYADMGHFGTRPIRLAWFLVVYPALLLNYLGQGAFLIGGQAVRGGKLFYSLVPQGWLVPMIALATMATIIASQALISGAFSLTSQAIHLGLFPRLKLRHTHHAHVGQIYVPFINWVLFAGCLALVVGFRSSGALASAYGLAVSGVMVITSAAMAPLARLYWRWPTSRALALWIPMTALSAVFLVANSLKFIDGGYVPLSLGLAFFAVMATWRWGRKATFAAYSAVRTMTLAELIERHRLSNTVIERTAILMVPVGLHADSDRTPALLQLLWDRYGVLPRHLIFLEARHPKVPYVHGNRHQVRPLARAANGTTITSVEVSFGFMEEPNVERELEQLGRHHEIDIPHSHHQWTVHVAHENLLMARNASLLSRLRLRLFLFLRLLSRPAYYSYGVGDEVQLSVEIMPVRMR